MSQVPELKYHQVGNFYGCRTWIEYGLRQSKIEVVVTQTQEGERYLVPNATTGTRTDTPLRDTPQSIQVIPREVFEDQQVNRLSDALRNVSGVFLGSNIGGFGQEISSRGFNRTTILRDGFRQPANSGFSELANIERVEVLKGPSSVLFGRAEPGGIVNLVSKRPLSEPFYELEFEVGNRAFFQPRIDITGPLTSDNILLYRLNALYSREDSFRDFDQELERFFVAPALTWNISEKTNLTASLQYIDSELPADTGIVASSNEVIDVPRSRNLGELEDIIESSSLQVSYDFEHRFSDNWKVRNAFRFLQEEESFNSAFVFGFDNDSGNVFRAFSSGIEKRDTYEIQTNIVGKFATGPIDHKLLFGVDYTREEIPERAVSADFTPLPPFNAFAPVYGLTPRPDPSTVPLFFDESATTRDTVGIYIQDQIDILDNLILLLGGRFDFFNQDAPFRGTVRNQYEEAFSPRLGLVYQPIQEVSLYTSYSRSFLPNFRTNSSGEFIEPEKGEQFEVGSRVELLEGRFVANLAFFHLTKQNVGVPDPNFPPFFGFAIASGEQRSQGIELDLSGKILPGWDLIANYAYLDTEITEDNTGLEGNRLFGVPEHSINLWSVYEIQSGDLQGLNFGIGFNFVGERFGDNANSFELDSYFLTNAVIAYRRDNWRVGLNFRNIFDVYYIDSAANSRIAVLPGEGFTIIGSVSIEF